MGIISREGAEGLFRVAGGIRKSTEILGGARTGGSCWEASSTRWVPQGVRGPVGRDHGGWGGPGLRRRGVRVMGHCQSCDVTTEYLYRARNFNLGENPSGTKPASVSVLCSSALTSVLGGSRRTQINKRCSLKNINGHKEQRTPGHKLA